MARVPVWIIPDRLPSMLRQGLKIYKWGDSAWFAHQLGMGLKVVHVPKPSGEHIKPVIFDAGPVIIPGVAGGTGCGGKHAAGQFQPVTRWGAYPLISIARPEIIISIIPKIFDKCI